MIRGRTMKTRLVSVLAAGLFALGAGEARAITIEVLPPTQAAGVGDAVEVHLAISGLGNLTAPSLGVFDVDIGFDPAILSFAGATFGDPGLGDQLDLLGLGSVTALGPGAGVVNLFELSLDPADVLNAQQASAFTLFSLAFIAVGAGNTPVTVSVDALGNALGEPLAAELSEGSVTVTGVPRVAAPASLVLVAAGLMGAGLARARRRRIPLSHRSPTRA